MKTYSILSLILITMLGSCQQDSISAATEGECSSVKITNDLDALTSADLFSIQEAKVSGNTLSLSFAYGGGCDPNHIFELYIDKNRREDATAPYYEGRVVFSTNDWCKRLDYKTFCFDLSSLKKVIPSGKLRMRGFSETIDF
ncbi:MAG: hypothetical protein U0X91_01180 [Spirosomataceae bacterium]